MRLQANAMSRLSEPNGLLCQLGSALRLPVGALQTMLAFYACPKHLTVITAKSEVVY